MLARSRRLVMYNDFVIIGPETNSAKIRGLEGHRCPEAHCRS